MGIIRSGSANIYYELAGDEKNKLLVVLHGNAQSMESMRGHIDILQNYYRVLSVDSRGHGKSEFGKAELSLGTMVTDLEALFVELDIKKACIMGFGDGANIALMFAVRFPDMVDRLILFGANYNFSGYNIITRLFLSVGYMCSVAGSLFDARNKLNKEYFALIVKEPRLKRSSLRAVKAKTLVVVATNDIVKASHSQAIASTISDCELVRIKGDRFWLFKNKEYACDIVREFLESKS